MAAITHELRGGRTLAVAGDLVEVRAPGGTLELRIRLTDDGPVLEMRSARLELHADTSLQMSAGEEVRVVAGGDVRVSGKTIHLN